FGTGASVLIGGAGLLMTSLMNTGLGDIIWKYNPWAWGVRLSGLNGMLQFKEINEKLKPFFIQEINIGALIVIFSIICLFTVSLIWFSRWEGRQTFE
ncbi:lantibiotic immunity ABC transporter MutG family permease subunit, partial [Bacillus amyloliquefaciens]|nr:lantibiotic immunity ABC transporter MutG family permease subunit [Bacillus amyloliquefaciens]